jgi:hypothetical protein
MKKVAIVQSNYIPWKGYFDLIDTVDEFILFDDMQFTKRDWRNRNKIKSSQGLLWLTVPVLTKGRYLQQIRETELNGQEWKSDHLKSLITNYRKAAHFEEVIALISPLYEHKDYRYLSDLNRAFLETICQYLKIETVISNSWDYPSSYGKSERLVNICVSAGASEYVSGPSAKNYLDERIFDESGVDVSWFNYDGYKEYRQLWEGFNHDVSILDLLFNLGKDAREFVKRS